jgi:hypothetical protein
MVRSGVRLGKDRIHHVFPAILRAALINGTSMHNGSAIEKKKRMGGAKAASHSAAFQDRSQPEATSQRSCRAIDVKVGNC